MERHARLLLALALVGTVSSGCGNDDEVSGPGPPSDLNGTWQFEEMTTGGDLPDSTLQFDAVIAQTGDSLRIDIGNRTLLGELQGDRISIVGGILEEPCRDGDRFDITMELTVSAERNSMSGTSIWFCPTSGNIPFVQGESVLSATRASP